MLIDNGNQDMMLVIYGLIVAEVWLMIIVANYGWDWWVVTIHFACASNISWAAMTAKGLNGWACQHGNPIWSTVHRHWKLMSCNWSLIQVLWQSIQDESTSAKCAASKKEGVLSLMLVQISRQHRLVLMLYLSDAINYHVNTRVILQLF